MTVSSPEPDFFRGMIYGIMLSNLAGAVVAPLKVRPIIGNQSMIGLPPPLGEEMP